MKNQTTIPKTKTEKQQIRILDLIIKAHKVIAFMHFEKKNDPAQERTRRNYNYSCIRACIKSLALAGKDSQKLYRHLYPHKFPPTKASRKSA